MSPSGAHCLARSVGSPVDYYDRKFHKEVNRSVNHRFVSSAFTVIESFHFFMCKVSEKSESVLGCSQGGVCRYPSTAFSSFCGLSKMII